MSVCSECCCCQAEVSAKS